MVNCCVPTCDTSIWRCERDVTFHDFPANPDLTAKWIRQINAAVRSKDKPLWCPKGRPVICSKHFLQTDFKEYSDSLKSGCIPTIFGHKYIGYEPNTDHKDFFKEIKRSPLIVKVNRPSENDSNLVISDVHTERDPEDSNNDTPKIVSSVSLCQKIVERNTEENSFLESLDHKNNSMGVKLEESHCIPQRNKVQTYSKQFPLISTSTESDTPKFFSSCQKTSEHSTGENSVLGSWEYKNRMGIKFNRLHLTQHNKHHTFPKTLSTSPSKFNMVRKRTKKVPLDNNLIEIGPNTFLKINPDVIKVNKKQTPSGNTVLQFVMDQKLAGSEAANLLPTLIRGMSTMSSNKNYECDKNVQNQIPVECIKKESEQVPINTNDDTVVQHVLGHLVDTHTCTNSFTDEDRLGDDNDLMDKDDVLNKDDEVMLIETLMAPRDTTSNCVPANSEEITLSPNSQDKIASKENEDTNVLTKAPVLFTTNMPISHCMMDKPKYMTQLRQKSRQIASLKFKVSSLTKKVEELEDRCIVQERQLSYSFIKRLKAIRKNAAKDDPCATYILEQIRCYSGKTKMRWSDSTLSQCAVWCRKAPYAYEYFKKADFFKLPCLGTVKRFMKKHPELKFQKVNSSNPGEESSSSDLDFDESDSLNEDQENSDREEMDPTSACETNLDAPIIAAAAKSIQNSAQPEADCNVISSDPKPSSDDGIQNAAHPEGLTLQNEATANKTSSKDDKSAKLVEMSTFPVTVDTSNLELQEIILPSGEVVQCYSSSLCNGVEGANQYYIIPNVTDQNSDVDPEYNVVQTGESLPVILQNLDNAQVPLQQEQLIFITNSSDQVECSETEVITA